MTDTIEVTKAKRYTHYCVRYSFNGLESRRSFTPGHYPDVAKGVAVPELYALRLVNEWNQANAGVEFTYWLPEEER